MGKEIIESHELRSLICQLNKQADGYVRDNNLSSEYLAQRVIHRPGIFIFGTYTGTCSICGSSVQTTLSRWDSETKCPTCLRYTNLNSFVKLDMKI